ncbi:hypothetical protein ACG7TL_008598 [Trametes sanguinea]
MPFHLDTSQHRPPGNGTESSPAPGLEGEQLSPAFGIRVLTPQPLRITMDMLGWIVPSREQLSSVLKIPGQRFIPRYEEDWPHEGVEDAALEDRAASRFLQHERMVSTLHVYYGR